MPTSIVFVVHTDVESLAAMVLRLGAGPPRAIDPFTMSYGIHVNFKPGLGLAADGMAVVVCDAGNPGPAEDTVAGSGSYAPYLAE